MNVLLTAIRLDLPLGPSRLPPEERVQRWVIEARRGDPEAMRKLYAAHVPRLFRALRPLAGEAVEDVVQDTFVKAFGALAGYQPQPGARFVSWLLRIGTNEALGRRRKSQREELIGDTVPVASDTRDGEAELERKRRTHALYAAIARMDERSRTIVCLRYGGELSVREVAEAVRLEEAHVRKICERARRAILSALAPNESAGHSEMSDDAR